MLEEQAQLKNAVVVARAAMLARVVLRVWLLLPVPEPVVVVLIWYHL
jgi:hypothetical protein